MIGRIRLNYLGGTYAGCNNEGLFIVGTGKWTGLITKKFFFVKCFLFRL